MLEEPQAMVCNLGLFQGSKAQCLNKIKILLPLGLCFNRFKQENAILGAPQKHLKAEAPSYDETTN